MTEKSGPQFEHVIEVKTPTDEFTLKGRPCQLSAFSYVPVNRNVPKERTFYNVDKNDRYSYSVYDRLFLQDYGYEPHLHRDDREHYKFRGLDFHEQEKTVVVPILSSSEYGHRLHRPLELPQRKYGRIQRINTEFYRNSGVNIHPDSDASNIQK